MGDEVDSHFSGQGYRSGFGVLRFSFRLILLHAVPITANAPILN